MNVNNTIDADQKSTQLGFTIIELMVATLIFSIILVVVTTGVMSFTNSYYKGLNSSATQTTARDLVNNISQGIEYAGGSDQVTATPGAVYGVICINNVRYYYNLGTMYTGTSGTYGVYRTTNRLDPCSNSSGFNPVTNDPKGQELLSPRMRLSDISVTSPSASVSNLAKISVGVAYGDNDLLCSTALSAAGPGGCSPNTASLQTSDYASNGATVACKPSAGEQFCAVSHLNTAVQPRITSN